MLKNEMDYYLSSSSSIKTIDSSQISTYFFKNSGKSVELKSNNLNNYLSPRTFKTNLKNVLISYFEQSSIHGFAYLVKKKLHYTERFGFWLVILLVSTFFWIVIGLGSVDRYNYENTVISIEKDFYFWNRTSPSVTICPLEKRLNRTLFEIYAKDKSIQDVKFKENLFTFFESLANSSYDNFQDIEIFPGLEKFKIDPDDYMELIYNLTGDDRFNTDPEQHILASSGFNMKTQQIITEFGICYVTNNCFADDISTEARLHKKKFDHNDREKDLIKINIFEDVFYNMFGFRGSIRVFVHNPYDVIGAHSQCFKFTTKATNVDLYTLDVITEKNFEKLTTIQQRKCRFPHESNLTHFSDVYTRNICYQECRIEAAFALCKCIPHFYPNTGNLKRICNYTELIKCFSKYTDNFTSLKFSNIAGMENFDCHCLENCKETKIIINKIKPETVNNVYNNGFGATIVMKGYSVIRYKRQVIFTFEDLLVSIGGTAGFFLGFSVLSIVEVVYYFTLRLYWYTKGYI